MHLSLASAGPRRIGSTFNQIVAQSVEDLEKLEEAVNAETLTGWEIAAAVIILVAAWPVAALIGRLVRRVSRRIPHTPKYVPELADRSTRWLVVLIGVAWAASLLGVDVGWFTVIVAFIAIVFVLMVRPLIENLAAGLLLQSRPSFGVGDEIDTNGYRGTVVEINARTTVIQTRDWMRIHIPNQDVLAHPLDVYTAFERRRSSIDLGIDYSVDPDHASRILVEAVTAVAGVKENPAPVVLARGFGDGSTILQVRWWHDPDISSQTHTLDQVVRAIRRALDDAGIDMPSPEIVVTRRATERG